MANSLINKASKFVTDQINGGAAEPYETNNNNWFKAKPYAFEFYDTNSDGSSPKSTVYLPISPSNLSITTNYATNVITTLYGIIEEHSEVRYFDITIQGNTGIAPRFIKEQQPGTSTNFAVSNGRSSFEPDGLSNALGKLGGFLPEVTNTIKQVANTFQSIDQAINGVSNPTGILPEESGYAAFHTLYKFFLKYKQNTSQADKAFESKAAAAKNQAKALVAKQASNLTGGAIGGLDTPNLVHPLKFLNYKDGNKYDCIPISFTMTRSAENPMLYYYSIKLRAFNLKGVDEKEFPFDDAKAKLGLGGLSGSLFSNLTSISQNAATLVSGLF